MKNMNVRTCACYEFKIFQYVEIEDSLYAHIYQ